MNNRRIVRLSLVLLALALPVTLYFQRWQIYDSWRLRNYMPPKPVKTLAKETAMNDTATRLFYVNYPVLEDKASFRTHCTQGEQTIVLGCFVPFKGIYLQHIEDKRLDGVMQVTAAHEMLHAAYQRLEGSEKKQIDEWLNAAYENLNDKRIEKTIQDYRENGADITNELHSILATEVRNLPTELENYYKRYFTDRQKVVAYSEAYEAAFTNRKAQVEDYDKQLEALKKSIDSHNSSLNAVQTELVTRQHQLDRLRNSNKIDEYNAAVPGFNQLVQSYNSEVATVRSLIDRYNQLVTSRNSIALEEGELVKAIDSRPSTIEGQ